LILCRFLPYAQNGQRVELFLRLKTDTALFSMDASSTLLLRMRTQKITSVLEKFTFL
jgi:hypothetical protein